MKNIEVIRIQKISDGFITETEDKVAVEEPLEIQLIYSTATGSIRKNIAVTMRTPGHDEELAAGFLFTEGVIKNNASIKEVKYSATNENRVTIELKENVEPVLFNATRNFYSTSSCGICGKASIEAIYVGIPLAVIDKSISINASILYRLQERVRQQQELFEATGGIHACVLFSFDGTFIMLREDVGRHNALDKIIGASLLKDHLPLQDCILFLSGRASFELMQKAAIAGIRIVAAVGAPSSMAVEMAKEAGITLIGFLKNNRFNIYWGKERVVVDS